MTDNKKNILLHCRWHVEEQKLKPFDFTLAPALSFTLYISSSQPQVTTQMRAMGAMPAVPNTEDEPHCVTGAPLPPGYRHRCTPLLVTTRLGTTALH